jgi:type II secretory pathway pseudopilin PulG
MKKFIILVVAVIIVILAAALIFLSSSNYLEKNFDTAQQKALLQNKVLEAMSLSSQYTMLCLDQSNLADFDSCESDYSTFKEICSRGMNECQEIIDELKRKINELSIK